MNIVYFAPFVPVVLPLCMALIALIVRRPRVLGLIAFLVLILAALPSLPGGSWSRLSPAFPWLTLGTERVVFQLSLGDQSDLNRSTMLLCVALIAALAMWSAPALSRPLGQAGGDDLALPWRLRAAFAGLLFVLSTTFVVIESMTPLIALVALGALIIGCELIGLVCAPSASTVFSGLMLPVIGLALMISAVLGGSATIASADLWIAGCLLLLIAGPCAIAWSRAPLSIYGLAQVVGLMPAAIWMLVEAPRFFDGAFSGWLDILLVLALIATVLGSINAVAARTLRGLLATQIVVQWALFLLLWVAGESVAGVWSAERVAILVHTMAVTTLLCLMLGRLAVVGDADCIADLKPSLGLLRRSGLLYALAAAAASGLPLTLGWTIRHSAGALPGMPFMLALIVACSTLSLLSLAPALAAFFRRPSMEPSPAVKGERGLAGAICLGLLLLLVAPYQWFVPVIAWMEAAAGLTSSDVDLSLLMASLGRAALQLLIALLVVGIANRALRIARERPVWTGGVALEEEPGWALPFDALRHIVAPLTVAPWQAALRIGLAPFRRVSLTPRRLEHRSWLLVIIVAMVVIVVFAMVRGGS